MHENDVENGWDYGTFEYLDNDEPIQYFPVQVEFHTFITFSNFGIICAYASY